MPSTTAAHRRPRLWGGEGIETRTAGWPAMHIFTAANECVTAFKAGYHSLCDDATVGNLDAPLRIARGGVYAFESPTYGTVLFASEPRP